MTDLPTDDDLRRTDAILSKYRALNDPRRHEMLDAQMREQRRQRALAAVAARACPICEVAAGTPCTGDDPDPAMRTHFVRMYA